MAIIHKIILIFSKSDFRDNFNNKEVGAENVMDVRGEKIKTVCCIIAISSPLLIRDQVCS